MKKATTDGLLYSPLQEFANRQNKLPSTSFCDKEIQTDDLVWPNPTCNSQKNVASLSRTKLDQPSQEKLRYPKSVNGIASTTDCGQNIDAAYDSRKAGSASLNHRNVGHDDDGHFENSNLNGFENHNKIAESNKLANSRLATRDAVAVKQETDAISDFTSNGGSAKNDSFQLKLRSPNFVECVAYWYSLECELEEMPPAKRQRLDEKFSQLFGKDHSIDYYFLSDEQKSITCRKRIAKHVVMELTNHYNQKKIASKQLFKSMAKHITSILLGRSLFPSNCWFYINFYL